MCNKPVCRYSRKLSCINGKKAANLDTVVSFVEEITPAQIVADRIGGVVCDVVGGDGRQRGPLSGIDTTLQPDRVLLEKQLLRFRQAATEANVVDALTNIVLNVVDRITQTFDYSATAQRFYVEIVHFGRENEESHHGLVRTTHLFQFSNCLTNRATIGNHLLHDTLSM